MGVACAVFLLILRGAYRLSRATFRIAQDIERVESSSSDTLDVGLPLEYLAAIVPDWRPWRGDSLLLW
jgi:hypothetical protein